jgi:hypothetical protein
LPNPDADGDGVPDTTYDCLNCHNIVWDPDLGSYVIVEDFRDCLNCHVASPHHVTTEATSGECTACHGSFVDRGLVDTNSDGYADTVNAPWVPTYQPSLVTPWPSGKDYDYCSSNLCVGGTCSETGGTCTVDGDCPLTTTNTCTASADCAVGEVCVEDGPNGGDPANSRGTLTGNCNYCHDSGIIQAGIPEFIGKLAQDNMTNHHDTGIPDYNLPGGPPNNPEAGDVCTWCHYMGNPTPNPLGFSIRTCENCHGIPSVHNIQAKNGVRADGDTNPIQPGAEPPYNGHIGSNTDCNGCHGFSVNAASAPESGPVVPSINTLSASSVEAGADTAITLTGDAFVNQVQNPTTGAYDITLTANVALTDAAGVETVLTPTAASLGSMDVVIPSYLAAGNYTIAAKKVQKYSNPKVLTITPGAEIGAAACSGNAATIDGSGFGSYLDAANSGTSVTGTVASATERGNVLSWSDTQIVAEFSSCPTDVTVSTAFDVTTATVDGGGPSNCSDYSDRASCKADPDCVWKNKDRVCVDANPPADPEICDDGIDNDGDDLVDCDDVADCDGDPACTTSVDCRSITDPQQCVDEGCNWNSKKGRCNP